SHSLPLAGRVGRGSQAFQQSRPDALDYSLRLLENIGIPEAQHPEAVSNQSRCAPLVAFDLFGVLAAVDLNHEPSLQAGEIDEVRTDWKLTAEAVALDLLIAQADPEPDFSIGHLTSQLASTP